MIYVWTVYNWSDKPSAQYEYIRETDNYYVIRDNGKERRTSKDGNTFKGTEVEMWRYIAEQRRKSAERHTRDAEHDIKAAKAADEKAATLAARGN